MKRLACILFLFALMASAEARSSANYQITTLVPLSDLIVYCEETKIAVMSGSIIECKVLQPFKGEVTAGTNLPVRYFHSIEGKQLPLGKALLFLRKEKSGEYTVVESRFVQGGKVLHYVQINNSFGPVMLQPQLLPENIQLAKEQPYGEKELLEDVAAAMTKVTPPKQKP